MPMTPEEMAAFIKQLAKDIADEHHCPEVPPCASDCARYKDAVALVGAE